MFATCGGDMELPDPEVGLVACGDLSNFAACGGDMELPDLEVGLVACGDLSNFAACGGELGLSVANLTAGS